MHRERWYTPAGAGGRFTPTEVVYLHRLTKKDVVAALQIFFRSSWKKTRKRKPVPSDVMLKTPRRRVNQREERQRRQRGQKAKGE